MIVSEILLKNYRNYENARVKFNSKINIIIGDNAQGKTNILESIYFLSITKSYRTSDDTILINSGKEFCKIIAKLKENKLSKKVEITLNKEKKNIIYNNSCIKRISDFIGIFKVIIMAPEDLDIIKGSPLLRRNLLNIELSKLSNEYIVKYNEYNKLLKMRNDYLKLLMANSIADYRYLDIITEKLIERAIYIYSERYKFIENINSKITDIYQSITGISDLTIKYIPNADIKNFDNESIRKALKHKLCKYREKEISLGMTIYGPHRDDFDFLLEKNDIKFYGSEGQQKLAIIALKLSLVYVFFERDGNMPVLLLDDIFSELDRKKKNKLIDYINNVGQVIITTNDIRNINKNKLIDTTVFEVKNKNIIEKGDINGKRK